MGLGDPVIPRSQSLQRIGPGSKAVRPNAEIYWLTNEGNAICLKRNKVTGRLKDLGTQAEGTRIRRMGKQNVRSLQPRIKS